MRILFDHGTPSGLRACLEQHSIATAFEMGWDLLSNGNLLRAAEDHGFDLLLTTDGRIRYQQNLLTRRLALVVLTGSTKWKQVKLFEREIAKAVNESQPSGYVEIPIPFPARPSDQM